MARWAIITFANTTCLPHRNRASRLSCHHEGQTLIHPPLIPYAQSLVLCSIVYRVCAEQKSFGAFYLLFHANRTRLKLTPASPNVFVYAQPISTIHYIYIYIYVRIVIDIAKPTFHFRISTGKFDLCE